MNINKLHVFAGILLIVSMLLWGFFLNASNFDLFGLLSITNLDESIEKFFSLNFVLFILFFPLSDAIILSLAKFVEKKELRFIVLIAGIIGLLLLFFLFSSNLNIFIIALFYLIGLILSIEAAFVKLQELKKWVMPRMISNASQTALVFLGIGIFLFTALTIIPNQQGYLDEAQESIVGLISDDELGSGLSDSLTDVFIQTQQQTLNQITDTQFYSDLKTVDDPKVLAYASFIDLTKENLSTSRYREQIKTLISQNQSKLSQGENIELVFDRLKENLPFYAIFEEFYWLFAAFILVSIYFLIANLILKPLTIIYGTIFNQILKLVIKKE
jgi:hypothetical protein